MTNQFTDQNQPSEQGETAAASLNPEIAQLFAAKAERRRQLAALPYPEKVRIVVQMQKMAAPIYRARGKQVKVWDLDSD